MSSLIAIKIMFPTFAIGFQCFLISFKLKSFSTYYKKLLHKFILTYFYVQLNILILKPLT